MIQQDLINKAYNDCLYKILYNYFESCLLTDTVEISKRINGIKMVVAKLQMGKELISNQQEDNSE
jgi:hypothetical protein